MTMTNVPYWFAQCDGATGNAVQPHCPAVGPGLYHDSDAAQESAVKIGWVAVGKKLYCPAHKPDDVAPPVEKVIRRPKAPAPTVDAQPFPDGGDQ